MLLSVVLAFRNKWTKSENKLCLSKRRRKKLVGGHFYLQIFNIKRMGKVEYSLGSLFAVVLMCMSGCRMGVRYHVI